MKKLFTGRRIDTVEVTEIFVQNKILFILSYFA
jgi:hypothetical protein